MAKIINLNEHPAFRKRLMDIQSENDLEDKTPSGSEWEEDTDALVLSQEDMSELVDAFKMVQDGLDKIKTITKLDYEEDAFK